MKTTILLVRHGQSEGNVAGVFTGHSGYSLSALGYRQAVRTAEHIKANYPVSAVYSSDLPRAFQTAEQIAKAFGLPVVTDAQFREIFAGDWEDKCFDVLGDLYPKDYEIWRTDIGNARCTNGESVMEVAERIYGRIQEVACKHDGECIVIAAHATPIRAALWKISGLSVKEIQKMPWGDNCAISELEYIDGKFFVRRTNITDHLNGIQTSLPANI